ncbi:hypothetical protein ACTJKO_10945 [Curtobacterium sp. 22159]|uniref:hypothetical protein n=1 Tax=Curtobacterium sp. 22159 TaxID=3453882 RepID=UPI003F856FE2
MTGLLDLGPRICIIGPSGSGKSTLADAIGSHLDLSVVHLDRYRYFPGTQWQLRPDAEFELLHARAVDEERWVMDGNYSVLLPGRLARATGLVLLDVSTARTIARYVRRTLHRGVRLGGLDVRERLSWRFVGYNLRNGGPNRRRRRRFFEEAALPKVLLVGPREVRAFVRDEGLRIRR